MNEPFDKAQDRIIPAILAKSVSELELKLSEIPEEVEMVHIDILEEDVWTKCDKDFEVHLMVQEPEKIMDKWVERGAKRIIVHESSPQILKYRDKVELGLEIEMGESLQKELKQIPNVDFVHFMSIDEIGEQGHLFEPKVFDRIKEVREKFPGIKISVDGGVNQENYKKLFDIGVDRVIAGSHFKELWRLQTKE